MNGTQNHEPLSDGCGIERDHRLAAIGTLFDLWFGYVPEEPAENTRRDIDKIVAGSHAAPSDRVLDLGCGTGRHLRELALRGWSRLKGVDVSAVAIQKARQMSHGCSVCGGGEGAITFNCEPFEDTLKKVGEPYQMILCMDMTLSLYPCDEIRRILALAAHALLPGGSLVAEVWNWKTVLTSMEGIHRVFDIPAGKLHYRVQTDRANRRLLFSHQFMTPRNSIAFPPQWQYVYDETIWRSLAESAELPLERCEAGSSDISTWLWMRRNSP
ncbi:MAG: methyltransferase domain-containing protein [Phycisphaerales bacterium]|nr:methyltransferase domain-containing protein [Phycisphaerales bacterium]